MEVSNQVSAPPGPFDATVSVNAGGTTTFGASMDMDMDIDLGVTDDLAVLEAESMSNNEPQSIHNDDLRYSDIEGISNSNHPVPHKVHIRGLDNLTTDDINAYAAEYFPNDLPERIEWIDDTSANIVYKTPAMGIKALNKFTAAQDDPSFTPPTLLRPAKVPSHHAEVALQVRQAFVGDKKQPRAYDKSRFYLMHPEDDPRERRRQEGEGRRRSRRYSDEDDSGYNRRRYDKNEQRRRRDADEDDGFDASMYDDTPSEARNSSKDRRGLRVRFHGKGDYGVKELLPGKLASSRGQRLRDRSASPGRSEDGDHDLTRVRKRSYTPPAPRYKSNQDHISGSNYGKELFPTKHTDTMDMSADTRAAAVELFPHKLSPNSNRYSLHRRSDAFDAADETADLFSAKIPVPLVDGASDSHKARSLESRITLPLSSTPKLEDRITTPGQATPSDLGFSIRGAARDQKQGFSIRGVAAGGRELFPSKLSSNAGKELFAEKLDGRGGRRRTAADMFH